MGILYTWKIVSPWLEALFENSEPNARMSGETPNVVIIDQKEQR